MAPQILCLGGCQLKHEICWKSGVRLARDESAPSESKAVEEEEFAGGLPSIPRERFNTLEYLPVNSSQVSIAGLFHNLTKRSNQMANSPRKVVDCRQHPSENHCTLTIAGKEDEVLDAAVQHAVSRHGHKESPELREQIKGILKDEK